MSAQQQVEATCDSIIAKLQAGLNAKIDAINTEASDQYGVAYPEGISFGSRAEVPYPWVVVRPELSEPLADASGRLHTRHRIVVVTRYQDYLEEDLARKLVRFQRAVREVVLVKRRPTQSYSDSVGGYGLQYVADEYGPTFQDEGAGEGGVFTSWVATTFTVEQQQDL